MEHRFHPWGRLVGKAGMQVQKGEKTRVSPGKAQQVDCVGPRVECVSYPRGRGCQNFWVGGFPTAPPPSLPP